MISSTPPFRSALRRTTLCALSILALLLVVAAAALPRRAAAQAPSATFQVSDCAIPPIGDIAVDCGYLTVPESHNAFDGSVLELATIILRSPNPAKAPDPLVFLQGGPGGNATDLAPALAQAFRPILDTRDIIVFDQRGTGRSLPGLFCPPLEGARLPGGQRLGIQQDQVQQDLQNQLALYTACGQAYQQAGVDLTKFNTAENAADIEDLRRALGLGQLNLWGASYGTYLALQAMQYRPDTLRSVVIESVVPADNQFGVDVPASLDHAITTLADVCAADAACNTAYPDLLGRWDALYARLNATPVQLPITNLETREVIDYQPLNGWDLANLIFINQYQTAYIPVLPAAIGEAFAGNYGILARLYSQNFQPSDGPSDLQSGTADLLYFAALCYEQYPFATADDFVRVRSQHPRGQAVSGGLPQNELVLELCANLGLGRDTPAFVHQPVVSSVPTLVVAGELDPVTPTYNAFKAASTLTNARPVVVYPRGGHVPSLSSPCLARAFAAFLNDPATTPDTSCMAAETLPLLTP